MSLKIHSLWNLNSLSQTPLQKLRKGSIMQSQYMTLWAVSLIPGILHIHLKNYHTFTYKTNAISHHTSNLKSPSHKIKAANHPVESEFC